MKQSGYFKCNNQITNLDILNAINKQPEVITDWLAWSENKRTGKGWVVEKAGKKYSVYYYPYKKSRRHLHSQMVTKPVRLLLKTKLKIYEKVRQATGISIRFTTQRYSDG